MNDTMKHLTLNIRARLSGMMFLQFFVWGAWCVTLGTYLGQGLQQKLDVIGEIYSAMPLGALVAPFFIGMIADRFFAAEKVLGVMHLLGAAALFWASTVTNTGQMFWIMLLYALCYNPTLALVNAISFNQMESPQKQFPGIRVFGTLGWIVAGLAVGFLQVNTASGALRFLSGADVAEGFVKAEATAIPLKIAAACSVLLGLFAFALPHTPPKRCGHKVTLRDVLGLDALGLLKDRSFAIFVIGSLLTCIPLAYYYYNFTNLFLNDNKIANVAGKMAMGQMSEVVFMLIMPLFFIRLGVKKMLLVGMLAWMGRYLLFAFGNPSSLVFMYYAGILLHGICYDFFFVTGQIYVDKVAPNSIQASAQGFIALITYGAGMLIGSRVSGYLSALFQTRTDAGIVTNWQAVWLAPAAMALVVIVLFTLLFKDPSLNGKKPETAA